MAGKAKFGRYHGPEQFTPFDDFGLGGTGRTFMHISQDETPELFALAEAFPQEFGRALVSLSWHLKNVMKNALRSGKVAGTAWKERSYMHQARRLDWARNGAYGKNYHKLALKKRVLGVNVYGKENMMDRWKGGNKFLRGQTAMGGRLVNAIRYQRKGLLQVETGAVTPSAAIYLKAVQGGKRGTKGIFQFTGRQSITPAMRRMFWAAGIPLRKGKTVLEQPKRPLVYPVFQAEKGDFLPYIEKKLAEYMLEKSLPFGL